MVIDAFEGQEATRETIPQYVQAKNYLARIDEARELLPARNVAPHH